MPARGSWPAHGGHAEDEGLPKLDQFAASCSTTGIAATVISGRARECRLRPTRSPPPRPPATQLAYRPKKAGDEKSGEVRGRAQAQQRSRGEGAFQRPVLSHPPQQHERGRPRRSRPSGDRRTRRIGEGKRPQSVGQRDPSSEAGRDPQIGQKQVQQCTQQGRGRALVITLVSCRARRRVSPGLSVVSAASGRTRR